MLPAFVRQMLDRGLTGEKAGAGSRRRTRTGDDIHLMIRAFQQATSALRYSDVPVVAAPVGLALGGGCDVCLHSDRVQPAAQTYTGLVEVGGLIPAAGGTKAMVARASEGLAAGTTDLPPPIQRAFETSGFARQHLIHRGEVDGKAGVQASRRLTDRCGERARIAVNTLPLPELDQWRRKGPAPPSQ